jgi:KUP system potassium uptake protein
MTQGTVSEESAPRGKALAALSLGALGVVYGDIGTSPLYAIKEAFHEPYGVALTTANVLGVLSLIFWSLNFIISFKYLMLMMRADNRGEGGVLALLALIRPHRYTTKRRWLLIMGGVFGAAFLYGDGVITPAISVLGAMEGLSVAAPALETWVVPIALVILVGLFAIQSRGTAGVGAVFGPITLVWFICISLLGIGGIIREPAVLWALNPWYAVVFFIDHGLHGFIIFAVVVLVVTGGEALYADMGHFGKRPIRLAWFFAVFPALVLNYFGQGALLLADPSKATNPFYALVPPWALWPMIVVATAAAVVASQALISGSFSLTRQAVQLGYIPRMRIVHTSSTESGQIYIPQVNWFLALACIGLVLGFQSASNLAATYGVAVTATMTITTILWCVVALERWHWPLWKVAVIGTLLLVVDLSFWTANLIKIPRGGWFPLLVAGSAFVFMTTWKRGRTVLSGIMKERTLPIQMFLDDLAKNPPVRVPGAAVFMTHDTFGASPVLLHHLKHNKVLHERVVLMSVEGEEIPTVAPADRVEWSDLGQGFYQVIAHYGFMETPSVPEIIERLKADGIELKRMETSYYLGRETLLPEGRQKLAYWRKRLFIIQSRNAQSATAFFDLPANRVVELGAQIQL